MVGVATADRLASFVPARISTTASQLARSQVSRLLRAGLVRL